MATPSSHKTTCCYCGVGCGIEVLTDREGNLSVRGDVDHPVNRGMLCSKGRYLHQVVADQSDRLLYPQLRPEKTGERQRVDWDTALDHVAGRFTEYIRECGPESVGFYVSGQFMTEEYYIANKLMKGFIGCNNIDTNSRLCMSSAVVGYKLALGEDACPVSYDDIEQSRCILIAGANPAWCHPILFRRLEKHKERNPDIKIVVVDPRRTQTCAIADLHLQIYPGTDIALFNGMAHHLISEDLVDHTFIREHTNGFAELKASVGNMSPAEAASICRIHEAQIRQAAEWIGQSPSFISMWAMGLNQSVVGSNKNLALLNLSLVTGHIGKPGSGPFSLTGQPNAMGGREVGGLSNMLAAHRDLANPRHRAEVAAHWGVETISGKPGLTATEMVDAVERGDLKAIWVMCTNPAVSMPNGSRLSRALEKADFVVVQDISSRSDTVEYADLVLPAAGWLEKQGTMTNSERRITHLPRVVDPPGEAKPDVWILCEFARRMGWGKAFDYADESDIYDEHKTLTRGTSIDVTGVSYDRLRREGSIKWPCPDADHPGTNRLFEDRRFYTNDRRAHIHGIPVENLSESVSEDYPFVLTTGRIRDQWHTMTKTGKVNRLKQHIDTPFLEIHTGDAARLSLKEGDIASVTSTKGEVFAKVRVSDDIKPGVAFLPMHWGKTRNGHRGRANNLTSNLVDARSKQPDFKFTAVQISRVVKPKERIVLVGAGAAARQFVISYREKNRDDEIVVFGREPHLFYNRVLLPDFISGSRAWDDLLTSDDDMIRELDVDYRAGTEITRIDPAGRQVFDTAGTPCSYDKLVLCTGSSPFVPPGIPMDKSGMFTLRSRFDADRIMQSLEPGEDVVIMGGGLLGLELASALDEVDVHCTIIERAPRLMQRQMDDISAQLLKEELTDRGMRILCDDMITEFVGEDRIEMVRTGSGMEIACEAVFVTVGTRPNVEPGRGAGIASNRGLIVDDRMQTSQPGVYAIGEIAEHNGMLYGITPSANEQAEVAAAHISGDIWASYSGSVLFNILKIHGMDVCSIGLPDAPPHDPSYEEITFLDRRRRHYKKCVVHENRLVGAILMGDRTEFHQYKQLIESKTELDDLRESLLRPDTGSDATAPVGRIVCSCNNVGEGNLLERISEGCTDLPALQQQTRAGTGCGSCIPELRDMLADALKARAA